jgi:Tfp pilus assembly protein PilO
MKNSTSFMLLLIAVGLFYVVISPRYEKVQALRDQSAQYKNILANVEALSDTRDDLKAKYDNMPSDEVARLEKILPSDVDTVNLAMNFDAIASKYGISIKSVRTVESKADAGTSIVQSSGVRPYDRVTVSFSFVSTYANFRKFMSDIEKSLRVIDVKSVAFQTTESGIYEFQVSVQTYWLK